MKAVNDELFFSIIIPVYNSENYIIDCLTSILNQNYKNCEVIIVNDGSIDNSEKIITEFIKNKTIFRLITTANFGASHARNAGIENSRGKYIVFVDSDDMVVENSLSYFEKVIRDNDNILDLLQTNYIYFTGTLSNLELTAQNDIEIKKLDKDAETKNLIIGYVKNSKNIGPGPCGKIYKSSIIKENNIRFNENLTMFEDGIFNIQYMQFCKNIYYSNFNSYFYRRDNTNSLTKTIDKNRLNQKLIQIDIIKRIVETNKYGEDVLNIFIFNSVISILAGYIYHENSVLSYGERISEIKKILNIDCYSHAIKQLSSKKIRSKKKKIIFILIKLRLLFLLDVLFRVKNII